MIKLIKKIGEGESWTSSIIGWKVMHYRDLDDKETSSLRIGIYLGFLLIKIEFVRL